MWASKLTVLLPVIVLLHPPESAASSTIGRAILCAGVAATLDEGIELFRSHEIDQAAAVFQELCEDEPGNLPARLWLAECFGRSRRQAEAVELAGGVLELDPGSAFAHTVIGRAHCPWLESWEGSSEESAWLHLNRAAALDSTEVDALELLWVLAIKRGEAGTMTAVLEAMGRYGLYTRACLEYTRWVLECTRPDAVLITNGDMDTYPSLVLQVHSALRPDVAIVNASLLNTRWYARFVAGEYGLPLPDSILRADSLMILVLEGSLSVGGLPAGSPSGALETVGLSTRILRYWVGLDRDGLLGRPLAFATTIPGDLRDQVLPHAVLAGPAWYPADSTGTCIPGFEGASPTLSRTMDIGTTRQALSALDTGLMTGDFVAGNDRNPYFHLTNKSLPLNVANLALLVALNSSSSGSLSHFAGDMAAALEIARALGVADEMAEMMTVSR